MQKKKAKEHERSGNLKREKKRKKERKKTGEKLIEGKLGKKEDKK